MVPFWISPLWGVPFWKQVAAEIATPGLPVHHCKPDDSVVRCHSILQTGASCEFRGSFSLVVANSASQKPSQSLGQTSPRFSRASSCTRRLKTNDLLGSFRNRPSFLIPHSRAALSPAAMSIHSLGLQKPSREPEAFRTSCDGQNSNQKLGMDPMHRGMTTIRPGNKNQCLRGDNRSARH
jgi:hypothetical protein